jgi:hypothetical protein
LERGNGTSPSRQISMGRPPSPDRLMSQPSVLNVKAETFAQRLSSYMPLISASAQHLSFAAPKPQTGDPAAFVHDLWWLAKVVQLGINDTAVVYS